MYARSCTQLRITALSTALLVFSQTALAVDDAPIERARGLFALLASNQNDAFAEAGTDQMQKSMGASQVQQLWAGLVLKLGSYQQEISAERIPAGDYNAVRMKQQFERGVLTIRLVLDNQQRLAGLWIDDVDTEQSYEPPAYVDRERFTEEDVSIGDESPLPGKLCLPKSRELHPAVVLVHGSGPNDEDETIGPNRPFRDLAWGLASRGIAVLRYDKRTHKYPYGKKNEDITFEYETIDDAVAAANLVAGRKDIDAKRVVVVGHSMGAGAAPFIAERDPALAGIVMIAAPARNLLDILQDQSEYVARADGAVSPQEREGLDALEKGLKLIREGRTSEVEGDLLGVPAVYWERLSKYDNVAEAEKLTCPMLLIQGERDYQVTMADFDIWKQRLGGRDNVTLKLYSKLNHLMIAGEGPSIPLEYMHAGHVDEQVIRDIADWVRGLPPQSADD